VNYIIIPARYESTRFPGKPLALINDLPMVVMTYRQCEKVYSVEVLVVTDSKAIYDECLDYGINCALHDTDADNGTERIGYYAAAFLEDSDLIVNVQCDEPLMDPSIPQRVLFNLRLKPDSVWTAVRKLHDGPEINNNDVVKCHVDDGKIHPQDFGRVYIPGFDWVHIGVYGYSVKRLKQYIQKPMSVSEKTYRLEQLRWQEPIACITVMYNGIGVDRPEHIAMIEERLSL
jgi:3-deoxy-manno-octulosonate cytidylyltransferase (CMP-KDO synthetase)